MRSARARALANLALVKYFGKSNLPLNLPAAGSLSLTLEPLETTTEITFDLNLTADEVILDDRAARDCATTLGLPVRGTLGVVLLAKREGLIPRVRPVFQQLLDAGLRIAPDVLNMALKLADE